VGDARRHAPATARNRDPILAVLRRVLPARGLVVEIASGSGEHAVHFARALPRLDIQPTDPDPSARESIDAWRAAAELPNVRPALPLDARQGDWPIGAVDAVLCCNMIHIAPWEAALGLLRGAARHLGAGLPLVLYGPFRRGGEHTSASNEQFDASLRARDPLWGVRDLDEVVREAGARGLELDEVVEMPANNLTVVLRRGATARDEAAR
jgi:hypothetical protein